MSIIAPPARCLAILVTALATLSCTMRKSDSTPPTPPPVDLYAIMEPAAGSERFVHVFGERALHPADVLEQWPSRDGLAIYEALKTDSWSSGVAIALYVHIDDRAAVKAFADEPPLVGHPDNPNLDALAVAGEPDPSVWDSTAIRGKEREAAVGTCLYNSLGDKGADGDCNFAVFWFVRCNLTLEVALGLTGGTARSEDEPDVYALAKSVAGDVFATQDCS